MYPDIQQERQQAHALLDLLPAAKLGAIRNLLAVMVDHDDGGDTLTEADRAAIQAGLVSLDEHGGVPMDEVLADFGLTRTEFDQMTAAHDHSTTS